MVAAVVIPEAISHRHHARARLDATRTLCFSMGRGSRYRPEEVAALSVMAGWVVPLMSQRHKLERLRDLPAVAPAAVFTSTYTGITTITMTMSRALCSSPSVLSIPPNWRISWAPS